MTKTLPIVFREIKPHETDALEQGAKLIREYSWGTDYPVDPLDEIKDGILNIGAYLDRQMIGFAAMNCHASPDAQDKDTLWLADMVIVPEFRGSAASRALYQACMQHVQESAYNMLLSCTDNPKVDRFFLTHGWQLYRTTLDESGGLCRVYRFTFID